MAGGPQSVTDLVVFGVVIAVGLVTAFVVKVFIIDRGKGNARWLPGQHYEIRPPSREQLATRPREKYVDPLGKINPLYVIATIATLIVVVFAYYIMIKGGLHMGN